MSDHTTQTVTLTPEALQDIIGKAVAEALQGGSDAEAKPAKAKPRKTASGRKALYQTTAEAPASELPETAKAAKAKAKSAYGTAVTEGINAKSVAEARESQLEQAMPGITSLAEVAHVGKDSSGQVTKSFTEMDRAGKLFWTWITLPGRNKNEVEQACRKLLGVEYSKVADAMKRCGYAYSARAKCWRTRCDGTPAIGGRKFETQHVERFAFADDS